MKHNIWVLIMFLFSAKPVFSQENIFSTNYIQPELFKNANAIIRNDYTAITILSIDKMIVKKKIAITILNEKGNEVLKTCTYYNNDTKINNISLTILNERGDRIKKIPESKFIDASAVDNATLYSDARVKYSDYTPTVYPYTAIFESEYRTSSTGFIPKWYPIYAYNTSVQNSEYVIFNPKGLKMRTKERKFENYSIKKVPDKDIKYAMKNQVAVKYESNSVPFIDLMPSLLVTLNSFTLKGVKGQATNWKDLGKWMHNKLLSGKNNLSEQTIAKAKALVKHCKNDLEKAKILYDYVQNKMRYVSVQVGIGGWEPMAANTVDEVSYGDCKGLTNYTMALFEAVGITSYYTVVYAKKKRDIDSSFASIQGNHTILNIPNGDDDIWLECTSKTMPFGFLGSFTDDRNVLVVTPEGGLIKRTPAYKNEDNLQTTKATITLDKYGNLTAELNRSSKGIQYDVKYSIENYSEEDLKNYYITEEWKYLNNLRINLVELINQKDSIVFNESIKASISNYALLEDNEYNFKLNTFNRNNYIPRRNRTRNLPLQIQRGYKDIDEVTIRIPKGYTFGVLPQKQVIKTNFGEYSIVYEKIDNTTFQIKKVVLIKAGLYEKEDYKTYRGFRKAIVKEENRSLILKRIIKNE